MNQEIKRLTETKRQWENDIKSSLQKWLAVLVSAAGGVGAMGMM